MVHFRMCEKKILETLYVVLSNPSKLPIYYICNVPNILL